MDEKPFQLLDEARNPIPMKPGKPKRQDGEYVRNGTCCIFVFTEPLAGWRDMKASQEEDTSRLGKSNLKNCWKSITRKPRKSGWYWII